MKILEESVEELVEELVEDQAVHPRAIRQELE